MRFAQSLIKMPGSRKEKRGQVHKRFKDPMFGTLETKANIDHHFPLPRHYRQMPPHVKELMMRDADTLSPAEIKNRIALSDHYKALYEKQVQMSKAANDKKNGKI
jgi:hypothetical protein